MDEPDEPQIMTLGEIADFLKCPCCGVLFNAHKYNRPSKFCSRLCAQRGRFGPVEARFLSFVSKEEGCWMWIGVIGANGYGRFSHENRLQLAHRWSYEHFVGPIPDALTIDHLCRNRACVNPAHLEPVTIRENTLRAPKAMATINFNKTRCIRGHEFTPENTFIQKAHGVVRGRACRICGKARKQRARLSGPDGMDAGADR